MPEEKENQDKKTAAPTAGIDLTGIADAEKRQQVEAYFKAKPELVAEITHEGKKARDVLAKEIEEMNRTQAQVGDIIPGIIQKLQEDTRDRDLNEGYIDDKKGQQPGYITQFQQNIDEAGVDFEGTDKDPNNPVKQACLQEFIKAVKGVPLNVKRQIRHLYVAELIASYIAAMNSKVETWRFGVLTQAELKDIPPVQFADWLKLPGKPPEEEVYQNYSPEAARDFVEKAAKSKEYIDGITAVLATLPAAAQEYFKKGIKSIESLSGDNPTSANVMAANLSQEAQAAGVLVSMRTDIEGKALKAPNDQLKKKGNDLAAKINQNLDSFSKENDPGKRKTFLDATQLQAEKTAYESELTAATPAQEAAQSGPQEQTPATEPEFLQDPEGWVAYQAKESPILFGVLAFLGLDKLITTVAKNLKGKLPDFLTGGKPAETVTAGQEIQKAQKLLKEKFAFTDEEATKISQFKTDEFFKLETKPEWIDQGRYDLFRAALERNKKSADKLDIPILLYVASKADSWQEETPTDTAAAEAAPEETQEAA